MPGWVLITLMTAGLRRGDLGARRTGARAGCSSRRSRASPASEPCAASGRVARRLGDERGSSPVEFVLVGTLLTLLTLGVLQLGLAIYVRNVVHDAAVEGAFHAALADTSLGQTAPSARARSSRARSAPSTPTEIDVAGDRRRSGIRPSRSRVRATLPLVGLLGRRGRWR